MRLVPPPRLPPKMVWHALFDASDSPRGWAARRGMGSWWEAAKLWPGYVLGHD